MFLLNSRLGLFSAPRSRGDPFSRSYGVNLPSSLTRVLSSALRVFPPPTCVGLRYGHWHTPAVAFLVRSSKRLVWRSPASLGVRSGVSPRPFHGASPTPRALLVPASPRVHRVPVVSDYQPILHRLRLDACGLGPTNPTRMFLPSETSGLRRTRFSRALSLLIPAFALRIAPGALPGPPSPRPNAPLPRPGYPGRPRFRSLA